MQQPRLKFIASCYLFASYTHHQRMGKEDDNILEWYAMHSKLDTKMYKAIDRKKFYVHIGSTNS